MDMPLVQNTSEEQGNAVFVIHSKAFNQYITNKMECFSFKSVRVRHLKEDWFSVTVIILGFLLHLKSYITKALNFNVLLSVP